MASRFDRRRLHPLRPFIFVPTCHSPHHSHRYGIAFRCFFAGDKGVHSFKECYVEITGDRYITGDLARCDVARMRESMGDRFTEALTLLAFTRPHTALWCAN